MKVLLIYAHPEPRSLNGALKDFAVRHLQNAGHEVQVSDLYAMRWKAGFDADDSSAPPVGEFWRSTLDSKQAFEQGTQSADIVAEQEKLLWADTVIFQFPLWWFSMPAIMKGWIDRVYAWGFRLRRRRAQRPPLGRPLWRRHPGGQTGDAGCHHRRLGGALRPARH